MNILQFIAAKNTTSVSKWWEQWKLRGGSLFGPARPFQDLRNDEQLRSYRDIEIKRRHSKYDERQIVNLAAWRLRRARRQAAG